MGRRPCCSKQGLNRGAWTALEDKTLSDHIKLHGEGKWRSLPKKAGLKRCGKSCRLRWLNYLRPDIKRGNISTDEEDLIIRLHNLLGNRWSLIAGRLPGRTDNEIKNYWNTNITKKLKLGQPTTISKQDLISPKIQRSKSLPNFLEKESRAVRTKASRCTRFSYDQYVRANSSSDINNQDYQQFDHEGDKLAVDLGHLFDDEIPSFICKDPQPYDFMMDFDFDDKFLSDFLSTEVFDNNTSSSSPNSDENLLFPTGMTPNFDSNLDWLQDQ